MNEIAGAGNVFDVRPQLDRARLWEAAHQLEGVFMSQLFQAMRATVPQDEGVLSSSVGEEVFASMYDEVVSELAAARMKGGLGDALFRQMIQRVEST